MSEFVYVSSVEGKLVTRFPSLQQSVAQYIGATRKGKTITWNTEQVVAIPTAEWRKYRRSYKRAIGDGSLKKRTESDFKAWQRKRADADKASAQKAEQERVQAKASADKVAAKAQRKAEAKAADAEGDNK